MLKNSQNHSKLKKQLNNYAKYSSLGFQMLFIILAGVFGGLKIDEWLSLKYPIFTVLLSIISVILSIYYAIKDFIKRD
ncbi:MAG: AtpZ/AtpI family protein [Bacteroidota bacterium]|nr:AtpZ/AtpI family protein [Bacteroidota bacterium]